MRVLKWGFCSSALHMRDFYPILLLRFLLCRGGVGVLWRESGQNVLEARLKSDTRCSIEFIISGIEHYVELGI